MKSILNWIYIRIFGKPKQFLCNHEWVEFGESNSPFEDKVFYCESCKILGYPKM